MDNEQNIGVGPQNKSGLIKKILIGVIILATMAVLIFVIWGQKSDKAEKPAELVVEKTDIFPEVFYSYAAKVVSIEEGKIVMRAEAGSNYLYNDENITVLINDETDIAKLKPATKAEIESGAKKLIERISFNLADLKVGDNIIAIAAENVKNKTEFTAIRIEVNE